MRVLKQVVGILLIFVLVLIGRLDAHPGCNEIYGKGRNTIYIATGSPGELGLLKVLAEEFARKHDVSVCWIKAGSGKALKLLKEKKVDLVLVHAPAAEKKAVAEGWATRRTLIASNEFYIVGPRDDPARVAESKSVVEAYRRIAKAKARFFSRGDNSGTHKREMQIWHKAGIIPQGSWYVVTKTFMSKTLRMANDEKGYFMTDSSTWIVMRDRLPNLRILFKGDKLLINVYHALCQKECNIFAGRFIDFLASEEGQRIIREFGREVYGEALYRDADYAKKYEEPDEEGVLIIEGAVKNRTELNLRDLLKDFTPYEVTLVEVTSDGGYHGAFVYRGVSLRDLLKQVQIQKKSKGFSKLIDTGVMIENKQGKKVFVSWGEIFYRDPERVLIAYSYKPIRPHHLNCGKCHTKEFYTQILSQLERPVKMPKLVIVDDFYTDRCIEDVSTIKVVETDNFTVHKKLERFYSNRIRILKNGVEVGEISQLYGKERSEVKVKVLGEGRGYHGIKVFEGVELKEVLENLNIEKTLNCAVVVYGIDGYRGVFSLGEIFLSGERVFIADKVNQSPIDKGGKFVVLSSGDIFADRMIKAVSEIRLIFPP